MSGKRTLIVAAATVAALGIASAPAHAHPLTCTPIEVKAAAAVPYPDDVVLGIIDAATATASCVDSAGDPHGAEIVLEWYYNGVAMPACPTQQTSVQLPGPSRVFTVEAVGRCERPNTSDAVGAVREVVATLYVGGLFVDSQCTWVYGSQPVGCISV